MDNRGDKLYRNFLVSLHPTQTRRGWIPYVILVGTLVLTSLCSYYAAIASRSKDSLRFKNEVERVQSDINNSLQTYIALLHGASGLFAASDEVSKQNFHSYVERLKLQEQYPGIQGIGFSIRVAPDQIPSLIINMRGQGVDNFALRPKAPQRSEYHSIIYLEPFDRRNQAAIGYDMFSEPVRRDAMERARDTGLPSASGRVTLVQEIDNHKQAGFLIYLPVYQQGATLKTVSDRRKALKGFVYSPFRADNLLTAILNRHYYPLVNIDVYDGKKLITENLIHHSPHVSQKPKFTSQKVIDFGGRTWTIVFYSRPELENDLTSQYIPYIILGGVILSIILFGMARSQVLAFNAMQISNQRLTCLYDMSSNLLLHDEPKNFLGDIFIQIANHLNLEIFFNYLLDTNSRNLRLHSYLGIDEKLAKDFEYLEYGQALCGTVAQNRQPIIMEDIQNSSNAKAQLIQSLQIKAYACYPLLSSGKLIGTIAFCTRKRTHFDNEDTTLLQIVADLVATALERNILITKLQHRTEELSQANRIKDEFLATLSHELRTPLNAILGWIQLLRTRNYNQEKTARALETIDRNSKSLAQLIEDILDVSRIINGKIRLDVAKVNVNSIIVDAIDTSQPAADAKQIQVVAQLDTQVQVWGDANRLQQVIWNLLSNAIKFTPQGGKVRVNSEQIGTQVKIEVSDNGQGIKTEFLPYVFDRFRQADGSNTRSFGGLGLGLAIVRYIIELHGGNVSVVSAGEGKGATFTVNLPVFASSTKPQSDLCLQATVKTQVPANYSQILNGIKIVLVEDEADARSLATTILEEVGAIVIPVANVNQGFEAWQSVQPDILISDIGMSEQDGYALITKIREQGETIPAIALTAFAREEDKNKAINAGFQEHITKPFDATELVVTIAKLVKVY